MDEMQEAEFEYKVTERTHERAQADRRAAQRVTIEARARQAETEQAEDAAYDAFMTAARRYTAALKAKAATS